MKEINDEYGKICDKIDRVRIEAWVSILKYTSLHSIY